MTTTITITRPESSNRDMWHVYGSRLEDGQDPGEAATFGIKEFPLTVSTPEAMLCATCAKEWERDVKDYQSDLYRIMGDMLRGRWSHFVQWRAKVAKDNAPAA